jgi:hypothetical protein
MHQWIRLEVYAWEKQRTLRREVQSKRWSDPNYQARRQAQQDRAKVMGQIYLAVAVLVGLSYLLFP